MPESHSSQTHRLLVVGVGSIGERHLRCFHRTERCQLTFCEPNSQLRQTIAERYPFARAEPSLEAAMEGGGLDAAIIAAPSQLHLPIANQLAQAGVHLLIEKPLSTTWDGVSELRDQAQQKSLVVMIAYVHRSHPAVRAVKQVLDEGRFGRPVQLVAVVGQNFPTYRPAYREIYYTRHETGGGAIQDSMTHIYNMGEWLVGPIERIVTDASHQILEGVTVEDTAHSLTRQGNVLGSYALNQYQAPNELMVTVVCERGTVRIDYGKLRWSYMEQPDTPWQHHAVQVPERDHLYTTQAHSFLDALEGKSPSPCTLADGMQTLAVNLASMRSATSGCWETVRIPSA